MQRGRRWNGRGLPHPSDPHNIEHSSSRPYKLQPSACVQFLNRRHKSHIMGGGGPLFCFVFFFTKTSAVLYCELELICFYLQRAVCAKFPIIKPSYQISWGYASEIPACRMPLATKWAPRFNPIKHADYKRGCNTKPESGMKQITKWHTYFAQAASPWCAGYGRQLQLLSPRASWHFPSFLKYGNAWKLASL